MAYEGVARDLVAALKFRGALAVADVMAAHMAANLPPDLRGAPALPAPDDVADRSGRASAAAVPADVTHWSSRTSQAVASADVGVRSGRTAAAAAQLAVIVPVPTVSARRRRRGFDPAGTLAIALARRLDRPLVACLERRDRASRQVGMSRKARRAPGRLEFAAHAPPPFVLLIDDVHTTGATLDAAARTLAAAGTTVVAALSYARTLTPSGRGRPQ
jgi:predicted amidophosphoribosyltransferase